jgi:hypothetical protein
MSNYVISKAVAGTKLCVLETVDGFEDSLDIIRGVSLAVRPQGVRFHMDPNFPKQVEVPDWVKNLPNAIVVSRRLKDFIAAAQPDVQYVPIQILDTKGRVASIDHFALNPLPLVDAIDRAKSEIDWNPIDPELIAACTTMVLDESRIPSGMRLFRLKHYPSKILFARELAQAIKQSGFTGIKFIEVEDLEY